MEKYPERRIYVEKARMQVVKEKGTREIAKMSLMLEEMGDH
jgi:hypothetical protein